MKTIIALILLGVVVGVAVETYNYHNYVHANAKAIAQMRYEIFGYSAEEALAGIAALPPLQVEYWNARHMPWIVNGSAWGGFGGILIGSVTGYVRRRKPIASERGEESNLDAPELKDHAGTPE